MEEIFFTRDLQKKSNLLSTIWNLKVLSLSYSYYEPKNNGIKFGDARHTFSCLVFSYFSSLTQHSLVRPLNPNTCLRSFSWSHWVISMSQSLQQRLVCVSFFFKPTQSHSLTFSYITNLRVFQPMSNFRSQYQPMVSGSKLSCWRLVMAFLSLYSWILSLSSSLPSVGTGIICNFRKWEVEILHWETKPSPWGPDIPMCPSADNPIFPVLSGLLYKNTFLVEILQSAILGAHPNFYLLVSSHEILLKSENHISE